MSHIQDSPTADLGEQIDELRHALDEHRDELRTVRDAIDDLRDAIEYRLANANDSVMEFFALLSELVRTGREPVDPDAAARRDYLDIRKRLAETIDAACNSNGLVETETDQLADGDADSVAPMHAEHDSDPHETSHEGIAPDLDPVLAVREEEGIEPAEKDSLIDGAGPTGNRAHRHSTLLSEDSTRPATGPALPERPALAVSTVGLKDETPRKEEVVAERPPPAATAVDQRVEEDHPWPAPHPRYDAIAAGLFGHDEVNDDAVRSLVAEHGRSMVDLMLNSRWLDHCEKSGHDPKTGKPPRSGRSWDDVLREIDTERIRVDEAYRALLSSYADGFGANAAGQLDQFVRSRAGELPLCTKDRQRRLWQQDDPAVGQRIADTGGDIGADDVGEAPPNSQSNHDESPQTEEDRTAAVEAAKLAQKIVSLLRGADGPIEIRDIRRQLGYPDVDPNHPLKNPVHACLAALRDAGNIVCDEPKRGDPRFSVPDEDMEETPRPPSLVDSEITTSEPLLILEFFDTVGGFVVFRRDGTWLAHADSKNEAIADAEFLLTAARNGVDWAIETVDSGRGHLQEHFPDLAERLATANDSAGKQSAKSVDAVSLGSEAEGKKPLEAERRPFTLGDFAAFYQDLHRGDHDAASLQAEFARLVQSKEGLVESLRQSHNKEQLALKAWRFGCLDAKRNTKQENAEAIVRAMMQFFTLSRSVRYNPLNGETYEDAIATVVAAHTDKSIALFIEDHEANQAAEEKAIANPESLEEFHLVVRRYGEKKLNDAQLAQFDRLRADQSRAARREAGQSSTVGHVASAGAEGLELSIKEGWHDRQNIPLFVVQLSTRVDRETFNELKLKAAQLGGWYSSFKKADAGFQFKSRESAQKFAGLLAGDADRSEELAARKKRRLEKSGDHLLELAERMESEAEEILAADGEKLKNTVRRADMAASRRGYAYQAQAFARTLRNIATDLEEGTAVYLDGVRTKTQVETLTSVLRRAKTARNQELCQAIDDAQGHFEANLRRQEIDNRSIEPADVRFVKYPFPSIYRRHLDSALAQAKNRKGVKQASAKMGKRIAQAGDVEWIGFESECEVESLIDFCNRCHGAVVQTEWIERGVDDYKRLRAADIHTLSELRSALRELLPHLARRKEDDPVTGAEDELRGKKLPGFFPTPPAIIAEMLDRADIGPEHAILEPSAGKGDILDAIRDRFPDAKIYAVEQNRTLQDILEAKGHDVEFTDFLAYSGQFNRILMNPPFESGLDAVHVRHAYEQLAPGGRLVAVMSAGPFFRSNRTSTEFREWLEQVGGDVEDLPEDAFKGVDVFRETGVQTRLVVIDKPDQHA